MTNPTNTNIHRDVGNAWDAIDGTTTTIVDALITRAQNVVKDITGTTSGATQDIVIRALADMYSVQNAMAGLGPESKEVYSAYQGMFDGFKNEAQSALRVKGYTLDGKYIRFSQVNP